MSEELTAKDDVAFAITSGYYPQLAAYIKYQKNKKAGHGSTGGRYAQVRGFNDSSVKRAKTRHLPDEYEGKLSTGRGGSVVYDPDDEEEELYKYTKMRKPKPGMTHYWKWMGGTDQYKMYGNQVWYMHGVHRDNVLKDYVDSFGENQAYGKHKIAPSFNTIYSNTNERLAANAIEMAEEVFGIAMEEVANEEAIAEAVSGALSQEEMGWESEGYPLKEGSYSYKPTAAIKNNEELGPLLDHIDKRSYANVRDMAKITIKNGKKVIERIMDVTEMPIDTAGQHGISTVPQQLKDAISDIQANAGGGKATKSQLSDLKKNVTTMFVKAINSEYNPTIRDLKKTIEQESGKEPTRFADVLKHIQSKQKVAQGKKPSKVTVAKTESSIKRRAKTETGALGSAAAHDATAKAHKDTALKYVVHMLATWGSKTGNKYIQAHRVVDFNDGQSIYAFIKMRQFGMHSTRALKSGRLVGNAMEFDPAAPSKRGGTMLHTGYSATLALEVHRKTMTQEESRITSLIQKRGFMIMRAATGTNVTKRNGVYTQLLSGPALKPKPVTSVIVPVKQDINKFLQGVMDNIAQNEDVTNALERMQPALEGGRYSYNPAPRGSSRRVIKKSDKMKKGGDMNKTMFWALPYIGIMTTEHRKGEYKAAK